VTTRTERFAVEGTAILELRLSRADVRFARAEGDEVVVELGGRAPDQVRIEQVGATIRVREEGTGFRSPVTSATVRVPPGTRVDVDLASGDTVVDVTVHDARLRTASGDITAAELTGRAEIRSASGDVRIERLDEAEVACASGDVRIRHVRTSCDVTSASGDVRLDHVEGGTTVKTASGDIDVTRLAGRRLDVKTVSGDTRIGIAPGRRVQFQFDSLSGDVRTAEPAPVPELDGPRDPTDIQVRSVSGDLELAPAPETG
jgi:DUF4097 and DUF4098 domain-containing protein YvlB